MIHKMFHVVIEMTNGQIYKNDVQSPIDYLRGFLSDEPLEHFKNLQEIKRIHIIEK